MHETQDKVGRWSVNTFGVETSPRVQARRLLQEVVELCGAAGMTATEAHHIVGDLPVEPQPSPADVPGEMGDVQIVLWQWGHRALVSVQREVDRKMPINRGRAWQCNGDGTGQHIRQETSPNEPARIDDNTAKILRDDLEECCGTGSRDDRDLLWREAWGDGVRSVADVGAAYLAAAKVEGTYFHAARPLDWGQIAADWSEIPGPATAVDSSPAVDLRDIKPGDRVLADLGEGRGWTEVELLRPSHETAFIAPSSATNWRVRSDDGWEWMIPIERLKPILPAADEPDEIGLENLNPGDLVMALHPDSSEWTKVRLVERVQVTLIVDIAIGPVWTVRDEAGASFQATGETMVTMAEWTERSSG